MLIGHFQLYLLSKAAVAINHYNRGEYRFVVRLDPALTKPTNTSNTTTNTRGFRFDRRTIGQKWFLGGKNYFRLPSDVYERGKQEKNICSIISLHLQKMRDLGISREILPRINRFFFLSANRLTIAHSPTLSFVKIRIGGHGGLVHIRHSTSIRRILCD